MRGRLAALTILLAGCSSTPLPPPPAAPPPEIAILGASAGGYEIVATTTGQVRATLPDGILAVGLNGAGDVAEGYLLTTARQGNSSLARLVPGRSFALDPPLELDGSATAAVLAAAPGLSSFVGPPTVLVVLTVDGRLLGYQHGSLLWTNPAAAGAALAAVGEMTAMLGAHGWQRVLTADGSLGASETAGACLPGPLAFAAGRVVYDCAGRLSPGDSSVPGERPAVFPAGGGQILAFPSGQLWRIDAAGERRTGDAPPWSVPPAAAPDGSLLYLVTPAGIDVTDPSGRHRPLVRAAGITSIAGSRDGNYLYALAGGRLLTFGAASGRPAGSVAVRGQTILEIAGG